ncbi:MAG: transcription factor TFIIS [Halobacteriales archaeon SW_9_67_24]|jgi:DNA-directed RNA polymerase subunit M|nr:MAG: transcription factor TFIIS [Halobacteriales archaeon SW_9_67_24]
MADDDYADLFEEITGETGTTESQEQSEVIDVTDAEDRGLPTTDVECPECGNDRAYWYMQQIRSADESETRFFVCTECEHSWREDDH